MSEAILSHLGGHRGLSEALLEPSWAILDAPMGRGAPRSDPGEGVGGGVPASLEQGKKRLWKREYKSSWNHLRPLVEAIWSSGPPRLGHPHDSGLQHSVLDVFGPVSRETSSELCGPRSVPARLVRDILGR